LIQGSGILKLNNNLNIMKKEFFKLSKSNGLNYAKKTGDFNKIHLDFTTGYNSIYGEEVCHGCSVFEKSLRILTKKYKKFKNKECIEINFLKHFSYNKNISIHQNQKNFLLQQNNITKAEINFTNDAFDINYNNHVIKKFNFFKIKKIGRLFKNFSNIYRLLRAISYHVGMVYPGQNSIIGKIKILFLKKKLNIKNGIYSKLKKKSYPFVDNFLIYDFFLIEFESIVRPSLIIKKTQPNSVLVNAVKKIKSNVLILGASGSLGKDLLSLMMVNKNINIFATYYKNKIKKVNNLNVQIYKINLLTDTKKIIDMIAKYDIKIIYYLPSTKILLNPEQFHVNLYNLIYLKIPLTILSKIRKKNSINFFYPSTIFINQQNKDSKYSQIKLKAEKKLTGLSKKKCFNLKISRLPQINSRQNLNILNIQYPSLIQILNTNPEIRKNFFF
jgi:hypothetical protein